MQTPHSRIDARKRVIKTEAHTEMGISGSQSHPNSSPVVFFRGPSLSRRPGRRALAMVALMLVKYVAFKVF